jgi:oligopeptide/dipeptide ABC transporter ATP-binding protein
LITHDRGVVAEMVDRIAVMYGGKVIETGTVDQIFHEPRHPYTLGLMMSLPRLTGEINRLLPIPGNPPSLISRPPGCAFHPRCRMSAGRELCRTVIPENVRVGEGHESACHFQDEVADELNREAEQTGLSATGGRLD